MIILSQLWNKLSRMSNAALPCTCRGEKNGTNAKPFLSEVFPREVCRKAESAGNGVLSSGEKNFSVHRTYMNFSRPRKRAPEAVLYTLRGRSMVEMLGVLAIIGVLSVGAIAGYQKAMFKYKLNRQAQALNMLLHNSLQLQRQLGYDETTNSTYLVDLLKKLELLPDGIKYISQFQLTDGFFNKIWVFQHGMDKYGGIGINFQATKNGHEICQNLVQTAKENSEVLWRVQTNKQYNDDSPATHEGVLYGNNYCTQNRTDCLQYLSLDKISSLCHICDEQPCAFYLLWK